MVLLVLSSNSANKHLKTKIMDPNAKQQVVERVKQASNILVTVSTDPSVDQLSACIGLTLLINGMEKHGTAVFSGKVPSTLEFLQPEKTLEPNTDSLRDFIISLDRAKADKLKYKVEDDIVRIFITPYRSSLSDKDLVFSQGDFNVDVVIALGVQASEHIDQAIEAHGRILHDATVVCLNAGDINGENNLGQINWTDPSASSLCEMIVSISEAFGNGLIDNQMATAFLTGIVAETERFSNPKTSPKVMTMSAQLMAAGANQQLIAEKLEKATESQPKTEPIDVYNPVPEVEEEAKPEPKPEDADADGVLKIQHDKGEPHDTERVHMDSDGKLYRPEQFADDFNDVTAQTPGDSSDDPPSSLPPPDEDAELDTDDAQESSYDNQQINNSTEEPQLAETVPPQDAPEYERAPEEVIPIPNNDEQPPPGPGAVQQPQAEPPFSGPPTSDDIPEPPQAATVNGRKALNPNDEPDFGGQLTANTEPEAYSPTTDPMSIYKPHDGTLLSHDDQPANEVIGLPSEADSPPSVQPTSSLPSEPPMTVVAPPELLPESAADEDVLGYEATPVSLPKVDEPNEIQELPSAESADEVEAGDAPPPKSPPVEIPQVSNEGETGLVFGKEEATTDPLNGYNPLKFDPAKYTTSAIDAPSEEPAVPELTLPTADVPASPIEASTEIKLPPTSLDPADHANETLAEIEKDVGINDHGGETLAEIEKELGIVDHGSQTLSALESSGGDPKPPETPDKPPEPPAVPPPLPI